MLKLKQPKINIIEQTAADLAASVYEEGLRAGMTSKYANHKEYTIAYLDRFIPKAVDILLDMLHNPATPESQKELINEAILERVNKPELSVLNEKIQPFKERPVLPIIVNREKLL